MDVLSDIRQVVDQALSEGMTLQQFKKELEPRLKAKGWWGKVMVGDEEGAQAVQLGSPWRLRTIYRTNMQTAYMAGRYKEMAENVDDRPYWQYVAVMDAATRPAHAQLNGLVFRYDDPFWDSFYPPNDWGCRCRVRALSEKEIQERNLEVQESGDNLHTWVDRGDGSKLQSRAVGGYLDPELGIKVRTGAGWNYNPGKASLEPFVPAMSKSGLYATLSSWMIEKTPIERLPATPLTKDMLLQPHAKTGLSERDYIRGFLAEFGADIKKPAVFHDVLDEPLVISEAMFFDKQKQSYKVFKAGREIYLKMLADTIKDPAEIWLVWVKKENQIRLCKRYIGIYQNADGKTGGFAVFDFIKDEWQGTTTFNPRSIEYLDRQRAGTLLYSRKKKTTR